MLTNPLVIPETRDDPQGAGYFMASRAGRVHYGRDYRVFVGHPVFLFRDAAFVKAGTVYSGTPQFKYLEFTDGDLFLRYMYVGKPPFAAQKGLALCAGQFIGSAQNIAGHYKGGMQNHVHVECYYRGHAPATLPPELDTAYHERKNRTYVDPKDYFEGKL